MFGGLAEKVEAGARLTPEEGVALLESDDLLAVGLLADRARKRMVGEVAYFVNNRHINYTNICKNRCDFCAFSRDEDEEGAYRLSLSQMQAAAIEAVAQGATEFHIVGGEHPGVTYAEVREMVAGLHAVAPEVHLVAFTASEIVHFAEQSGLSEREVLLDLRSAGLGSLPGGGAEVFSPRVRQLVCPRKISGERWLSIHTLAHECGLPTNATMLYGHVETPEERIDHLIRLREAQDASGGFQAFIPLAFHSAHTKLSHLPATTGVDDLKMVAVARLMLDNFRHIKAYWVMIGLKTAQLALFFGANDLDGTIHEETITFMAGGESGRGVAREELVRLIQTAGRVPVERDSLYSEIRRW
jgi:aminodeoxyfutalosine synthase